MQTPTPSLPGPSPKIILRLPPRSTPVKQEPVEPAVVETPNATPRIKLTFRLPPKLDKPVASVKSDMMEVDPVVRENADKVDSLKDSGLVAPSEVPSTPTPAAPALPRSKAIQSSSDIGATPVKNTAVAKTNQTESVLPAETTAVKPEAPKVDETPKPKIKLKFKFNSGK
jgi:hypothetical protein